VGLLEPVPVLGGFDEAALEPVPDPDPELEPELDPVEEPEFDAMEIPPLPKKTPLTTEFG